MSLEHGHNQYNSPEPERPEIEDIYIHALSASGSVDSMTTPEGSYYVTKYPDNVALYTLPKKDPLDESEYRAIPISELDTTEISAPWTYVRIAAAICVSQVVDGETVRREHFFSPSGANDDVHKIWYSQRRRINESVRNANENVQRRLAYDLNQRGRLL